MVERNLAKVEVASSRLVSRSNLVFQMIQPDQSRRASLDFAIGGFFTKYLRMPEMMASAILS